MGAVAFLDDVTAQCLGWPAIWAAWAPVTPYGRARKAAAGPFLPGEETAWEKALSQLRGDLEGVSDETLARVREHLRELPDVSDILAALRHPGYVLTAAAALALKTFLRLGRDLAADPALDILCWTDPAAWGRLLVHFQDPGPTFSVDHVADPPHRSLRRRVAEVSAQLHRERKAEADWWQETFGVRPDGEGVIRVRLPSGRATAERLKAHPAVRWRQDTPFESVFECSWAPETRALAEELERLRTALAEAEARCLARLTQKLRVAWPVWRRLADDVAGLDLRLAKVALAGRWRGVAPEPMRAQDDGLSLRGGVHPGLAEVLVPRGERVTPIDWAVDAGFNGIVGMNMGGKTAAMQLLGLCQVLAQHALPVPAKRFRTRLFGCVRWGPGPDGPDIDGLSAFGREVARLCAIWRETAAAEPALVFMDEPGRTTNPREGEALAVAWVEAFHRRGRARVTGVVATHFGRVMSIPGMSIHRIRGVDPGRLREDEEPGDRVRRLRGAVDYRIERCDAADVPEEGIAVATWLGAPDEVVAAARAVLRRAEDGAGVDQGGECGTEPAAGAAGAGRGGECGTGRAADETRPDGPCGRGTGRGNVEEGDQ